MVVFEQLMGRKLGAMTLFAPNSRGIIDVYTLSHIIHGLVMMPLFATAVPWQVAIMLAVLVECTWEVFENTPTVIARYRRTASADYQGDTIINSLSDVTAMLAGCGVAMLLPVGAIVGLVVACELLALYLTRDNLTLNIVMLLHPFEGVKRWQNARNK